MLIATIHQVNSPSSSSPTRMVGAVTPWRKKSRANEMENPSALLCTGISVRWYHSRVLIKNRSPASAANTTEQRQRLYLAHAHDTKHRQKTRHNTQDNTHETQDTNTRHKTIRHQIQERTLDFESGASSTECHCSVDTIQHRR